MTHENILLKKKNKRVPLVKYIEKLNKKKQMVHNITRKIVSYKQIRIQQNWFEETHYRNKAKECLLIYEQRSLNVKYVGININQHFL